ncbi:protein of unknown function [Mesotoga infera]|uniref:Uncharacterized protein n=1 Tax=Mesotoga infera TaxID=1236046 RepID=A0A7Z7LDH2_9BACT|nr:protein of unknown function [Mesotoga infera]
MKNKNESLRQLSFGYKNEKSPVARQFTVAGRDSRAIFPRLYRRCFIQFSYSEILP